MNSLLTVGSVAFDQIETPYGKTDKILGGAGTFCSLAASNFGIQNNLVSVVGYDFPKEYLELIEKHKIDIEGVEVKKDEKTFFWSGKYHQNMNQRDTLITELNSLGSFAPVVPDNAKKSDVLLLGNLTPVVQRQVIEQMSVRPKFIAMDTMNFWMDTMLDELVKTISMVDILLINDDEARQLSEEHSLPVAAKKILKMGPKYLIIKKGEHGALLFSEDDFFVAPALPLDIVFDPTGAGDTFAGGLMGYLTKTMDFSFENLKNAVIVGSAMASFTVEKFGTEKIQYLDKDELAKRISMFKKMTEFNLPEDFI